jgi:LPS sulfotransferase NodH
MTAVTNNLLTSIQSWRTILNNQLMELGVRGQKDYTRFIILARSRTGSNFLRGLLNAHPQITVLGELFQNERQIGWAYPGYSQSNRIFSLFLEHPVEFLSQKVFRNFPTQTRAVGFKIFYYHAQSNNWRSVWPYLQQDQNLHVIHMKRQNLLKTYLSKKKADLTDVWVDTNSDSQNRKPFSVSLDFKECQETFSQTRAWENEYDAFFGHHKVFEIYYEDLSQDYSKVMQRVFDFLNVDQYPVKPQTRKQSKRSLSETIENYAELKNQFQGSEWETFFTD